MNPVTAIIEDAKRYAERMGWSMTRFCNEAGIHPALKRNFSDPNWNPHTRTLRKIRDCIERGKSIIPVPEHCYKPDNCRAKGHKLCSSCGQLVRRHGSTVAVENRSERMVALYKEGYTLEQIGQQYGLTRERVRQIMTGEFGVNAKDGGQAEQARRKRAAQRAKREAECLEKHGCTVDQHKELRRIGREHVEAGGSRYTGPIGAFISQRSNARHRGIPFEIKLWEWWTIWQASGRWEERGRGNGYMMCRFNDTGPYAVGNVYIGTGCENSSVANRKADLPIGVQATPTKGKYRAQRMVSGEMHYLGTFSSPELAHAAYLAAAP